jgi:Protein of unknown function (DUF3421)
LALVFKHLFNLKDVDEEGEDEMQKRIYVVSSIALVLLTTIALAWPTLPSVNANSGEARSREVSSNPPLFSGQNPTTQRYLDERAERYSKLRYAAQNSFAWIPKDQIGRVQNEKEEKSAYNPNPKPGYIFLKVSGGHPALFHGTEAFICRVIVMQDKVNGPTYAPGELSGTGCLYPYDGKALTAVNGYDVLMQNRNLGFTYQWQPIDPSWKVSLGPVPARDNFTQLSFAPSGGVDKKNGGLYMCRKQLGDGLHLGKYAPGTGFCYVPSGGKESDFKVRDGFDILLTFDGRPI